MGSGYFDVLVSASILLITLPVLVIAAPALKVTLLKAVRLSVAVDVQVSDPVARNVMSPSPATWLPAIPLGAALAR